MIRGVVIGTVLLAAASATADDGAMLATSLHVGAVAGPVSWDGRSPSHPGHFDDTIAGIVIGARIAEGFSVGDGIVVGAGLELAGVKGLAHAALDGTSVESPAQVAGTARVSMRVSDHAVLRAGVGAAFGTFRDSGPPETMVRPEIYIGPIADVSLSWQTGSTAQLGAELQVGYLTDDVLVYTGRIRYMPVTLCLTAHWGRW